MKSKKKSIKSKKNTAKLIINSNTYQLPILKATEGSNVVDVTKLYSESGYFTYDPGFTSTAACESKVTYIDGDKGILRYRGIDVSELAEKSDFIEVSNLLIYGDLPNQIQLKKYRKLIVNHTMLNEQLIKFFNGFRRDAHPMAMMVGVMGALSAFYQDSLDINEPHQRMTAARRIIAKAATIGAMSYKYSIGQPFVYPDNKLSYAENFLNMCFSVPSENYKIPKIISKAMDIILILHADHEQNASTSTVRLAGSSGANPFACIASGIACLWGAAHGGANEACLRMLDEIGNVKNIPEFINKAKDKNDPFRLMGFGHRVYKNYDPRAKVMQKTCHELLDHLGLKNDPKLAIAMELEKIALEDEYFIEKKLYPNVDFYSGIVMKAMGFPMEMFTVLFAVGRTVGWVSQWDEMIEDKSQRIGRPRQLYVGNPGRDYQDISIR